ncbi:sn-glycerol-3-phosphate ABC transporter ATP-binding protein UgpC [Cardiobacteriaceae bacterium TAE3-ERU3]|nr:sn-glycerol-3-phosphate ABC transporter ATP-binding protein UgpC [Cardiobacteriaceae bacterium TAE3-ERU3]
MATLTLKQLGKTYGKDIRAVNNVNVDIADGEFIVIVGPSGCGKSTLLRMVAGLETITDGDLLIDGKRVNDLEPRERGIAMVFQNYALYPHMTNRKNMGYGLKLSGMNKDDINRRVESVAEKLQLTPFLDRKPAHLSGGQRQRVAMGRAIVREPKVFLFDEPLSNLDAKLRVDMRKQIKQLQRELGTTSLYVTHDQVEAMTMADRLIVLKDGEVQQIGAPMTLYNQPANRFVAQFIGSPSMNLIDGVRIEDGTMRLSGTNCRAPGELPNGDFTLGIRPEHIQITNDPQDLAMTVDIIEHLGGVSLLHGRLMDGNDDGIDPIPVPDEEKGRTTDFIVQTADATHINETDIIHIRLDPAHLHLFDAQSGERLDTAVSPT